jgi:hypothetical protein
MKRYRKFITTVATGVLLAAGGVIGIAGPANAAVVVGVCTITVGEPHASSHVNGTINSYGRLSCSIGMPNIHLRAQLEKSNGTTWNGNTEDWLNTSPGGSWFSNKAIPCAGNHGTYRTNVAIVLHAPPGVNPQYHAKTYTSIWRSVACGVSRTAPPSTPTTDSDVAEAETEAVTLTFLDDGTIRETIPEDLTAVESSPESLTVAP